MQPPATNSGVPPADDLGGFSLRTPHSALRAFWVLVVQSFQRHWRVRQMGWIALGLLAVAVVSVALVGESPAGWGLADRRVPRTRTSYRNYARELLPPNRYEETKGPPVQPF